MPDLELAGCNHFQAFLEVEKTCARIEAFLSRVANRPVPRDIGSTTRLRPMGKDHQRRSAKRNPQFRASSPDKTIDEKE